MRTIDNIVFNEIGNLSQGVGGRVKGTDIIYFIKHEDMPLGKIVIYDLIVVDYHSQKEDPYGTNLTVGVNLINYTSNVGTPTADMPTYKLLFNNILSTPYDKFVGIDIKNFYLNMPMALYEYMILPIEIISQEIINEYQIMDKVKNGFIMYEILRVMYGLPQAGIIAKNTHVKA